MKRVLIANRGEIAVRVIRACRELGLTSVAVYSTADKDSLHTKIADESLCIGPGPSARSYLSIPAIISAAEVAGVDAIHPGYGFLSENHEFAEICERYSIKFIGPKSAHIRALGNKVAARAVAVTAKVPLLPGSTGVVHTLEEGVAIAKSIGFPIIIKAAAGGGGRGMKIVKEEAMLEQSLSLAQAEALAAFGNSDVFIERYCEWPRHVEVQIIADAHGNAVFLGERDCSIQRRHQKLIEEAPCPVLTPEQRQEIGQASLRLVRHVGYESVGTVEFLLDRDGKFYFMEVNTRIQVEHPVTEMVTGVDLIKEQILVAQGEKLSFAQKDIVVRGHAIECRINAEDPISFAPWPGRITGYHEPGGPGVRVDSMVYEGLTVPPYYDSMIAKLIAYGRDREEAMARKRRALFEMKVDGIRTNISFHQKILENQDFKAGNVSTRFLESFNFKGK